MALNLLQELAPALVLKLALSQEVMVPGFILVLALALELPVALVAMPELILKFALALDLAFIVTLKLVWEFILIHIHWCFSWG